MDLLLREEILCPICKCEYCTETGDPKTLKCGHSLCVSCLEILIQPEGCSFECAECRYLMVYDSKDDIPTSFTIKQIIGKINENKAELSNPKTFNETLEITDGEHSEGAVLPSMGSCALHNSPLHFGCTVCDQWLCGSCVCLNHSGDKKMCKVFQINEALMRKKEQLLSELAARTATLQETKTNGKINKKTAEEFIELTVKHISLSEKFLKEFSTKQLTLVEQENYITECDEMVSQFTEKLKIAHSSTDIKETIDKYLEKKSFIHKEKDSNDLFQIWKNWMKDVNSLLIITNNIYIKWTDSNGLVYWTTLTVQKTDVILRMLNEEESPNDGDLIMEETFFTYSSKLHHAFIEIGNESCTIRVTFLLDENVLGEEFMKRCCFLKNSFKGSKIYIPGRSSGSLCFGEKSANFNQTPKPVEIGDRKQYLKPIIPGAIGIFNNFENGETVDVNNMLIYINMDSGTPAHLNVHYISYEGSPRLKLCFGTVYKGFDELAQLTDLIENQIYIKDCGVLVDSDE